MVRLYDKESGVHLGDITEAQLQFLIDELEEEALEDQDYYVNLDTLEVFEDQGADPALIELLRLGLRGREEMEIRWEQD